MPQKHSHAPLDRFGTHRAFIECRLAELTPKGLAAPLLWFVLWDWADGSTGLVRGASVQRIERETGLARNTARDALKRLRAAGLLEIDKPGRVPVYRLKHLEKAQE